MFRKSLILTVLLCAVYVSKATLTPKSPKSNKEAKVKPEKIRLGPVNQSVVDRNLVAENPYAKDILGNNQAYFKETGEFNVDGLSLGYVTPWNNHGYDLAKLFGNKFTHISPVWFQIRRVDKREFEITGAHDVDSRWVKDVKKAGRDRGVKIVPRMLFDGWTIHDFNNLLKDQKEIDSITKSFVGLAKKWGFQGFVIEIWSQIAGRVEPDLLIDFIKHVGTVFPQHSLDLILVVPPQRNENSLFSYTDYDDLYDYVTAFSLMTYDFSNLQRPGPNAPIQWVEECIKYLSPDQNKRDKILTGLNFYGNAYTPNGGKTIVGHEYIDLLKNLKGKMEYDPDSAESYFEVRDASMNRYLVFYPTLHSIKKRLQLANELGTGVSIWELGQGLDYFYDLL